MNSGFYGISGSTRLSSKAGAMEFAIMMNAASDERGRAVVDYKEAKRLFDFICRNVKLPDVAVSSTDALLESYNELMGTLAKQIDKKESKEKEV